MDETEKFTLLSLFKLIHPFPIRFTKKMLCFFPDQWTIQLVLHYNLQCISTLIATGKFLFIVKTATHNFFAFYQSTECPTEMADHFLESRGFVVKTNATIVPNVKCLINEYLIGSFDHKRAHPSLHFCQTESDESALLRVTWMGRSPKCTRQPGICIACKKNEKSHSFLLGHMIE